MGVVLKNVTVQIVTYNSSKDIKTCIESILGQSYPVEKIIVVDNNSKDSTLAVVRNFKEVILISNQKNNGFAGGHNQAIKQSKTDYVLILNPDVFLHRNYILNALGEMEKHPDVGCGTGKLYRDFKELILDTTGISMKKNRRAFDRGAGEKDVGQFDTKTDIFGVSGAAAIFKRKMIEDISSDGEFFDETFFAYKEDVDVCWRAQIFGWKSLFIPEATAEHKRGWSETRERHQIPSFIREHSYINRYYCMLKNDHILFIFFHFVPILIYEAASMIFTLTKERELLTGWSPFRKEYKKMIDKRRVIKKNKRSSNNSIYKYFKGLW